MELRRRFGVHGERMNAMKADLSATLERFRADMAGLREVMFKRNEENTRSQTGLLTAAIA